MKLLKTLVFVSATVLLAACGETTTSTSTMETSSSTTTEPGVNTTTIETVTATPVTAPVATPADTTAPDSM